MAESKKRKLTGNKKRFAEEFLIDRNAKQAAIRAGYSVKTAYSQGQRLKKDPLVKEYIDRFTDKQSAKLNLTAGAIAVEVHMVNVPSAVHIAGGEFVRVHPLGGVEDDISAIEDKLNTNAMIDDLYWWTDALKTARAATRAEAA